MRPAFNFMRTASATSPASVSSGQGRTGPIADDDHGLALRDGAPIAEDRIVLLRQRRPGRGFARWATALGLALAAAVIALLLTFPASIPVSDRKSTRLNSSHMSISYAVFCLKKKKK